MKNNLILFAISCFFNISLLHSQETPKPAPTPPTPPMSSPTAPKPPLPPSTPQPENTSPPHKPDTTIISIGDKQIMIIDNDEKKSGEGKADWEKDLEKSMKELKENLKNAKFDMEHSKQDMEESKKELEEAKKEMEQESIQENEENQSPDGNKLTFNLKKKKDKKGHKAADISFLDFDFGVNLLNVGSSVPKQMEDDLKLKTWGSWTYTFTFLPTKIYLGTPHLMLMTGLGWRIGQFEFKEKIDFDPNKTLVYHKDDNLKQSQFVIHQLQIPLSIYWKSNRIKGLGDVGFGIGGYAGILLHQELETETATPDRDIETNEDFGFKDFRYGLSARLDIGALKLFANFDLNKLWKDNDIKNIETGIWVDF